MHVLNKNWIFKLDKILNMATSPSTTWLACNVYVSVYRITKQLQSWSFNLWKICGYDSGSLVTAWGMPLKWLDVAGSILSWSLSWIEIDEAFDSFSVYTYCLHSISTEESYGYVITKLTQLPVESPGNSSKSKHVPL